MTLPMEFTTSKEQTKQWVTASPEDHTQYVLSAALNSDQESCGVSAGFFLL